VFASDANSIYPHLHLRVLALNVEKNTLIEIFVKRGYVLDTGVNE
jgi:hypothetical protein